MITQKFDTVGDYLDFVKSPTDMDMGERSSHKTDSYDRGWYGGVDWEQALALAERGWPEGVEKVERFTNRLTTTLAGLITLPTLQYGVEGDFGDIGLATQGNPEFMVSIVESHVRITATPPKIIRIVMNTCVSAAVDADRLILRGAAVAALVLMLERHNFRCEVDLNGSNRAGDGLETWVRVKEAHQPLHLPNLVFLLAHPSSFRRLMFSSWEHLTRTQRQAIGVYRYGGYGYVGECSDKGDIYVAGMESHFDVSDADTIKWITSQLESQGIEVSHDS